MTPTDATAVDRQVRRFAAPDGVELVADVAGDPAHPTVVLLHGRGQTRHSWAAAMRSLVAEGYRVINYDTRGHGDSGWSPTADYSLEARMADLQAILATVSGPVALVGASMGAMTALYVTAQRLSPNIGGLVLVDMVPRSSPDGVKKIRSFLTGHRGGFATLEEAADAVAAYNPHRPRPADISGLAKNLRDGADGRLYWHWDPNWPNESGRSEELVATVLDLCRTVTVPSLLVRGLRSEIVHDEGLAEFRAHFPALEVYDVAGAGHMIAGDRNDAFNQGMIGFLRRRFPAGPA